MGNENVPLNYYFFFISRDAILAIEREGDFADQQCSVSYALAYLKVHYDVKPDVSVEIYDL